MALSTIACLLTMLNSWLVAQGKLKAVYLVGIANASCFITLNGILALSQNDQVGVLLLVIPSLWGIATSIIGLRRLARIAKARISGHADLHRPINYLLSKAS